MATAKNAKRREKRLKYKMMKIGKIKRESVGEKLVIN